MLALLLLLLPSRCSSGLRRRPRCPWQVFVASALMEWRHAREKDVARKIFEKGLEVAEFATVPEYVLAYAEFLCGECCSPQRGVVRLSAQTDWGGEEHCSIR